MTLVQCTDRSVREAISKMGPDRLMGGKPSAEIAASAFWDAWDGNFESVISRDGSLDHIRLGEKCMTCFAKRAGHGYPELVGTDVTGILYLPGGEEITISIDEVSRRGSSLVLTRYMVEPGIRSVQDLYRDIEMRMWVLWARGNLPGSERVVVRWVLLSIDSEVECSIPQDELESSAAELSRIIHDMRTKARVLPNEGDDCDDCRFHSTCPRFLHLLSVRDNGPDTGSELVDAYMETEEKIQALKRRQESLEAKRDAIAVDIVRFADSNGLLAVSGSDGSKILVRHERKVELPSDKTEFIQRAKDIGLYDEYSMPNYPRIRSEILKGTMDPRLAELASVEDVDKVYPRKTGGNRPHVM